MEPEPLYDEDTQRIEEREKYIADHPEESQHPVEPEEPTDLTVEVPERPSYWRRARNTVSTIVNSPFFETLITLCILFNTLAMALEHFEMEKMFSKVLEYCNLVSDSFCFCCFYSFTLVRLKESYLTVIIPALLRPLPKGEERERKSNLFFFRNRSSGIDR